MTHRFEGRTALVTGAARGIGRAIAARLHAEGADVVIADIDGQEAEAAAAAIAPDGVRVAPAMLDITDEQAARRLIATIRARSGRLDVLVNNAAILDISRFEELTLARFREVLSVNLDGALICTLASVPLMRETGGSILMTASIMGLLGSRDAVPYSTAKGGLVSMMRCLACDLAPMSITVNAIAPGFIDTRMAVTPDGAHEHETEAFRKIYLKHGKILLGRPGKPEDLAGPAAFVVSSDASYVTCQVLLVDGGVSGSFG